MAEPARQGDHIKRVALVCAGGPAPAANAVISSAAISFLEDDREVIGFFHGYSNLEDYHPVTHRLLPDEHYRIFEERDLSGLRNSRGIVIGTARANPGKGIEGPADLDDPKKTLRLRNVYNALVDLVIAREKRGKHYGTVVLAEGLSEMLPESQIRDLPRDEHGHLSLGRIDLGKLVALLATKRYEQRTGRKKKLTGLQLGYESR